LSFIGGLAWLSYHHPRFTTKLLCILLALCLLLQTEFKAYKFGWIAGCSWALKSSQDRIRALPEEYDHIFYIAYGIIVGLLIFCIVFPRYKGPEK
jgi:hypothetical protein